MISAVNIRKGGTLTILRECLSYLSGLAGGYKVVALVHDRSLCDFPGIEYIEMPDTVKSWGRRLWCEYVTMKRISSELAEKYGSKVYLWLSLHDTTPNVDAERQAVYCQTSFPFLKWKLRDFRMDFKIPLFALFTRYAYRVNVHRNDRLVVQAQWLRDGLGKMLGVNSGKFIVAPVKSKLDAEIVNVPSAGGPFTFLYPASGDCHKNFETLCEAARLLEKEVGDDKFEVVLTLNGRENRYTRWLKKRWGNVRSVKWNGIMSRDELFGYYGTADCLVFPSRIETWGLPISEFMPTGKPMLVSDLAFGHETTAGAKAVGFFNPESPKDLKDAMLKLIRGDRSSLRPIPPHPVSPPAASSWDEIFSLLLQ